jgi:hypothetical protein
MSCHAAGSSARVLVDSNTEPEQFPQNFTAGGGSYIRNLTMPTVVHAGTGAARGNALTLKAGSTKQLAKVDRGAFSDEIEIVL